MPPTNAATAVMVVKNMGTVGSQLWNVVRRWLGSGKAIGWASCGDILPIAQSTSLAALSPASTAPSMEPTNIFMLSTEYTYILLLLVLVRPTDWEAIFSLLFSVCGWNHIVWPLIWKLLSSTFTWNFLFCIFYLGKKKRRIIMQTPTHHLPKRKF